MCRGSSRERSSLEGSRRPRGSSVPLAAQGGSRAALSQPSIGRERVRGVRKRATELGGRSCASFGCCSAKTVAGRCDEAGVSRWPVHEFKNHGRRPSCSCLSASLPRPTSRSSRPPTHLSIECQGCWRAARPFATLLARQVPSLRAQRLPRARFLSMYPLMHLVHSLIESGGHQQRVQGPVPQGAAAALSPEPYCRAYWMRS